MNALTALTGNRTLSEVERAHKDGLISDREWLRYLKAWSWSAPRFSGQAGASQDRYYDLHGRDAYVRRMNRVRRLLGFEPYETDPKHGGVVGA